MSTCRSRDETEFQVFTSSLDGSQPEVIVDTITNSKNRKDRDVNKRTDSSQVLASALSTVRSISARHGLDLSKVGSSSSAPAPEPVTTASQKPSTRSTTSSAVPLPSGLVAKRMLLGGCKRVPMGSAAAAEDEDAETCEDKCDNHRVIRKKEQDSVSFKIEDSSDVASDEAVITFKAKSQGRGDTKGDLVKAIATTAGKGVDSEDSESEDTGALNVTVALPRLAAAKGDSSIRGETGEEEVHVLGLSHYLGDNLVRVPPPPTSSLHSSTAVMPDAVTRENAEESSGMSQQSVSREAPHIPRKQLVLRASPVTKPTTSDDKYIDADKSFASSLAGGREQEERTEDATVAVPLSVRMAAAGTPHIRAKSVSASRTATPQKSVATTPAPCATRRKNRVSFTGAVADGLPQQQSQQLRSEEKGDKSAAPPSVEVNGTKYTVLGLLGKGGSSSVYRVLSGGSQLLAFKKICVSSSREDSEEVFDSYANEIALLRRLKGSKHIIELIDSAVDKEDMSISMIMEMGEADLAKVLVQKQATVAASSSSSNGSPIVSFQLNPFFVRMAWKEMLEAVDHIHTHRIVHGDLKPANFVFVRGSIKLIDFGIAKAFSNDTTNIYRESQIGTVNYMAPEAIAPYPEASAVPMVAPEAAGTEAGAAMRMRLGRASDIWSLGCILYQLLYGRPPFASLSTIQKLHAIPNPKFEIPYPPHLDSDALDSIRACLQRDPRARPPIRSSIGESSNGSDSSIVIRGALVGKNDVQLTALLDRRFLSLSQAQTQTHGQAETDTTHSTAAPTASQPSVAQAKATIEDLVERVFCAVTQECASLSSSLSSASKERITQSVLASCLQTPLLLLPPLPPIDRAPVPMAALSAQKSSNVPDPATLASNKIPVSAGLAKVSEIGGDKKRSLSLAVELQAQILKRSKAAEEQEKEKENSGAAMGAVRVPGGGSVGGVRGAGGPLRVVPPNLATQLQSAAGTLSKDSTRAQKWMKPAQPSPEKQDMKSVLEKRIGDMRKFLEADPNSPTRTINGFVEGETFF